MKCFLLFNKKLTNLQTICPNNKTITVFILKHIAKSRSIVGCVSNKVCSNHNNHGRHNNHICYEVVLSHDPQQSSHRKKQHAIRQMTLGVAGVSAVQSHAVHSQRLRS